MRRLALLLIAVLFLLHAFDLRCVAEDSFISFRFARNLASGHGLVWNVGEPPVEGYTNFLWVLLSALAYRLGLDVPLWSQVLGVLSGLLTLSFVYLLGVEALGLTAGSAALACGFLAISGPFATWAASGMETSLFTLLVTAALYLHASGRPAIAYASLTLATLTRPEGFLVFSIVAASELLGRRSGRGRSVGVFTAAYLLPAGAYFVWRYRYFGWLLPNTFYAKTGGGVDQLLRGASYLGTFSLHFLMPLGLLLLCPPGVTLPGEIPRARLAGLVAVLAGYTAYVVWVGGDYMAMYRFFVPVLPIVYLLFALAVDRAWGAARSAGRRRLVVVLVGCAAALTFLQSTPLERRIFPKPALHHGTWGGVTIERWHAARLHLLARFFRSRERGPTTSLATHPIGILGYETSMRVYGFHGLVDPVIAHGARTVRPVGRGLAGHEKQDPARALSFGPTFFMFSRALTGRPLAYPSYDPATDAILRRDYVLSSEWLEDEENGERGYFTFLERRDAAIRTASPSP